MNDRHPTYVPLGFLCFAVILTVFMVMQTSPNITAVPLVHAEPSSSQKGAEATPTKNENNISDDRITFAVENGLHLDSGVSSRLIDIDTKSGIVTLSGSVSSLLSRSAPSFARKRSRVSVP